MNTTRPSTNRYKDTQDKAEDTGAGTVTINNDAAYIKANGTSYIVDEQTAFVDVDEKTLYTGFENVPDYRNGTGTDYVKFWAIDSTDDGVLDAVFIYGGVGLGKTHLMHSIGHFILDRNPQAKVLYVTSETFTNELINSIQNNKNEEFRNKYRNIDVLMIDDIQFISKKEGTQEEFFHTFNALYESNKQIIISSDRPPKEIKTLEDRLRSRFEWGLIADVQPPDYETRIAILKKKAERDNLTVPDDVMAYIAKNIASNIRELEGALTRIVAFATLTNQDISIALAENSLKDIFSENSATPLTPELIQQVVAEYYNIRVEDIQGSKKPKNIAFPRQVSMYLCRKLLDISLPKIGESFGGRDHTTVIYAISKIEKQLESDEGLQKTVHALEKEIKES